MIRLLALLACLLLPTAVHAWGANGHRTIAHLAAAELTPAARAQVALLLAGETDPTLPGIAAWADRLRDDDPERGKATAPWHYVNFGSGCVFDAATTCKGGDCVIGAINRSYLVLSDPRRPLDARREALKFLVHFVGDVHQPLHASPRDDKGGNDDQVNWQGKGSNLHRVWDRTIPDSRGLEPADHAAMLRRPATPADDASLRSQTPAVDWAVESCRLVGDGRLDPPRRVLDQAYIDAGLVLAEARLAQAGHRLAAMLNHALR